MQTPAHLERVGTNRSLELHSPVSSDDNRGAADTNGAGLVRVSSDMQQAGTMEQALARTGVHLGKSQKVEVSAVWLGRQYEVMEQKNREETVKDLEQYKLVHEELHGLHGRTESAQEDLAPLSEEELLQRLRGSECSLNGACAAISHIASAPQRHSSRPLLDAVRMSCQERALPRMQRVHACLALGDILRAKAMLLPTPKAPFGNATAPAVDLRLSEEERRDENYEAALSTLLALLHDRDRLVRAAAVLALGNAGDEREVVVSGVIARKREDAIRDVREAAEVAMTMLAVHTNKVRLLLRCIARVDHGMCAGAGTDSRHGGHSRTHA